MRRKLVEQRDRFVFRHADDAVGAARDCVERLAVRDRMRPDQRMRDQRHLRLLLRGQGRRCDAAHLVRDLAVAVVVDADQPVDPPFHRVRQIVVGGVLIGEERVATGFRDLDRIEHRRSCRYLEVRIIGVEVRAGIGKPRRLSILGPVGQDQDVRVVRVMELVDHVRLGRAEAARERDILCRRQRLVAQHQHLAAEERLLDVGEPCVGKRLRKIDVGSFEPEAMAQRLHLEHGQAPGCRAEFIRLSVMSESIPSIVGPNSFGPGAGRINPALLEEFRPHQFRQDQRDFRPYDNRREHD